MNGIHDMGGMEGMGPLPLEANEPVFHHRWESRVFACWRALLVLGKWRTTRPAIERIPAADYLRMSYYERVVAALDDLLVSTKLISAAELESGTPASGTTKGVPPLTAAQVPAWIARGAPGRSDVAVAPQFHVGQQVRVRNMNPSAHTRLPRYVRGRPGIIERDYGVFPFLDTYVYFREEKPQHVYAVRFAARELWGDQAHVSDAVYVDLWDDYLEPA